MLTIKNLQVKYGNQLALSITEPITFEEGDRIGIIGSNGAGKSTFVKSVLGLTNYKGSIHLDVAQDDIAAHMQANHYVTTMPIRIIIETILNTNLKKNPKLSELIHFFNFEHCLNKRFSNLSGGEKQRLTIIIVLIQNKPLVFFDEVTSGLDFETRQKLMAKLVEWYSDKKATICVVSHYYEELEQLVDKLLLLEKGEVVDFGSREELFQKYCGRTIMILDNNEQNQHLTSGFTKLLAPDHLIALSCKSEKEENTIAALLIKENVNFKRSNSDIEIMSINAKGNYEKQKSGGKKNENNVA